MTSESSRAQQLEFLMMLLKPLVRFALRHSHSIHDFENISKIAFLAVAEEEILKTTKKVNVSRLSVFTGMYRSEVRRLYKEKPPPPEEPLNILGRVIGQWRHDPRFTTKSREPRVLTYKGPDTEFQSLVESVSKNINSGTVLFELKRRGMLEITPKGLKLLWQMVTFKEDPRGAFGLLASDIEALVSAVEQNILFEQANSNLHVHTEYDNIAIESLSTIRRWLVREGKRFHKRAREFISKYDRDVNPDLPTTSSGGKITVTTFSLTSPNPDIRK